MKKQIEILKNYDEIGGVKKGEPMNFDKANNGNANPFFKDGTPTSENCPCCVASIKARLEGFNVHAKPYDETNEIMMKLSENTNIAFIDKNTGVYPIYLQPKENHMPRLLSWFENNLENEKYYSIEFYWKGSSDGHIMLIFKNRNELELYDPQSNEKFFGKEIESKLYMVRRNSIKLMNISDCFLNKSVVDYVLEESV